MKLFLIVHKTNWKSENFEVLVDLPVFEQLRKLWKERGGKFILFLSLFLTAHINFQYKLKYHASLFIVTFCLFSSIALLIFFSCAISLFFCSSIFDYKFNEYVQMSLLTSSALFCVKFQFNKEQKLTSKINKHNVFLLKSKLSQIYVIALSD